MYVEASIDPYLDSEAIILWAESLKSKGHLVSSYTFYIDGPKLLYSFVRAPFLHRSGWLSSICL